MAGSFKEGIREIGEIMNTDFSRRNFLKGMGLVGATAAAGAALAGCTPASSTETKADASTTASASEATWRTAPAEITDFAQTIDCDVVVCGHGFAGITACRELAEEGKKVVLVEKQPEDSFAPVGNEFAALNAQVLQDRGVPHIDPVEFFQNWMTITGNSANQELVMKFAQNSEENSNWYLSALTDEDKAAMTTSFFPQTEHQMDHWASSNSGRAFAASTAPIAIKRKFMATTAIWPKSTARNSTSRPRRNMSSWKMARSQALLRRIPAATSSSTAKPWLSRAAASAAIQR